MKIGREANRKNMYERLGNLALQTQSEVRNLGVSMDCDLTFKLHIINITKTAFCHVRRLARIR